MSSPASRIVIIGAGIGGLTLLLLRRGIIAEILEQAPELREVGPAVALAAYGGDEPRYSPASGFRGLVPIELAAAAARPRRPAVQSNGKSSPRRRRGREGTTSGRYHALVPG